MHPSTSIIMFAADTTVVGLITTNDATPSREEESALGVWCQDPVEQGRVQTQGLKLNDEFGGPLVLS